MLLKRIARGLGWTLLATIGAVALALFALWAWPVERRPASDLVVERTPERVARGRYLFEHVANCDYCHSEHDPSRYAWPVQRAQRGAGFCAPTDPPGCTPNITSHREAGVGAWTDGELIRAIREGVGRDDRALIGMPVEQLRSLSDEDVQAVVAYVRTLAPLDVVRPRVSVPFPFSLLAKFSPRPLEGPVPPPGDSPLERGAYLATVAQCVECHQGPEGQHLAGGLPAWSPFGDAVAANLTPDPEEGLGGWSREQFIARFQSVADMGDSAPAGPGDSAMPWASYAGMTEADLGDLFAYLQGAPIAAPDRPAVGTPTAP